MLARLKPIARHRRNLRVDRVRFSERELDRVDRRIENDRDRLRKAGFTVVLTEPGLGTNRILVEFVTRRNDAASYFAKRYGPAVRTRVIAPASTYLECRRADTFEIAPDGLSLKLNWTTGGGAKTERIEVTEYPDRVEVGIVERVPVGFDGRGARRDRDRAAQRAARRARGLGRQYGGRMLQSGASPGDPPCPEPDISEPTPLERAIAEREDYGMNTDPAYVQSLMPDGYTDAERRWIEQLRELEFESDVYEYLTTGARTGAGRRSSPSIPPSRTSSSGSSAGARCTRRTSSG